MIILQHSHFTGVVPLIVNTEHEYMKTTIHNNVNWYTFRKCEFWHKCRLQYWSTYIANLDLLFQR